MGVLGAHKHLSGIVFDQPHVVAQAQPIIEAAGLTERCATAGGDFFTDTQPAADVYVLAQILHDWDDEQALTILRNCRRSITRDGRLVLLEQVVPDGDTPSYAKLLDLIMLVLLGGKERTESEWRDLLKAGGFELLEITPRPATNSSRPHPPEPGRSPPAPCCDHRENPRFALRRSRSESRAGRPGIGSA